MISIIEKIDGEIIQKTDYYFSIDIEKELDKQYNKILNSIISDKDTYLISNHCHLLVFAYKEEYHIYQCFVEINYTELDEYQKKLFSVCEYVSQSKIEKYCMLTKLSSLIEQLDIYYEQISTLYELYQIKQSLTISYCFIYTVEKATKLMLSFLQDIGVHSIFESEKNIQFLNVSENLFTLTYQKFIDLYNHIKGIKDETMEEYDKYSYLEKELYDFPVQNLDYMDKLDILIKNHNIPIGEN